MIKIKKKTIFMPVAFALAFLIVCIYNYDSIYHFLKFQNMYSAIQSIEGCKVINVEENISESQIHTVYFNILIDEASFSKCLDVLKLADELLSDPNNILNKKNYLIYLKFSLKYNGGDYNYTYYIEASNLFDFNDDCYPNKINTIYRKNSFCTVLINAYYQPFLRMSDILVLKEDVNIENILVMKTDGLSNTNFFDDTFDNEFYQYLQKVKVI